MNITTPIDDQDARALAPVDHARLVDGEAATLVVDTRDCMLLAANAAAEKVLGLVGLSSRRFDRAMPAWQVIREFVDRGGGARTQPAPLLFWTPAGPRTISGTLEVVGSGVAPLVRIAFANAPSTAGLPASAAAPTETRATPASDLATLREIARRIRAGTATHANTPPSTGETSSGMLQPASRLPPALDFQPPANDVTKPGTSSETTAVVPHLAKLAHELRTPLSAIVSLAEIMRDERIGAMGNPRYKAYAADIHDSARHTLDLIGAMLDGEHGEGLSAERTAAKPRIDLEPVDLNDITARCVSTMRPIGARGAVTLDVVQAAGLPRLRADRRALRQIILNLLSNALRFTPKGGRITLTTALHDNGDIELAVADTGSGMRPADIDRALGKIAAPAPLQRIRVAGEQTGFGFGLPLVRELTEAHGGRIAIDSTPGIGTRVTVVFPADHVMVS